jgi:mannose PTS system EIIA component
MTRIVIVAHEPLAASLQAVARHVYPDCGVHLAAVDVPAGAGLAEAEAAVRKALAPALEAGDDVLVLVDVFGATPCNAAMAVADGVRVRVVAGVNVPMLWRTLCYASQPLDELVGRAVAGATQGVMQLGAARRQNQGGPVGQGPANDQVQHHHQQ